MRKIFHTYECDMCPVTITVEARYGLSPETLPPGWLAVSRELYGSNEPLLFCSVCCDTHLYLSKMFVRASKISADRRIKEVEEQDNGNME